MTRLGYSLLQSAKGVPPTSWEALVTRFDAAGLRLPGFKPAPGAVITFGTLGGSEILLADPKRPPETVAVVRRRLQSA